MNTVTLSAEDQAAIDTILQKATATAPQFLPADAIVPESESRYMKFSQPENKFRVMGSAIVGFELWIDGKPVRKKRLNEFTPQELLQADMNKFTNKKRLPQYFWAFPVFNYQTQRIEILEVIQVTVMRGIEDYLTDPDYGNPSRYDLNVVRDESTEKITYRVKASPPKEITPEMSKLFSQVKIDLEAFFNGGNPLEEK